MSLLSARPVSALDPALDIAQYAHTAWKARDGFMTGAVLALAQTPDGYLWLGTESGLVRFDGLRPVAWHSSDGEQLPSNFINALLVSRDGTLWIATHKGLASVNNGRLTKYRQLGEANIVALAEDRDGTVWVGGAGISEGSLCAKQAERMQCFGHVLKETVTSIYEDRSGKLWIASETAVWRWKPGTAQRYALPSGVTSILDFAEDDSGAILASTSRGLERLVDGRWMNVALSGVAAQFRPARLLRSRAGSLWIGTWQGLLRSYQGRVDSFTADEGLSSDFVSPLFEDREGNLWVGTQNGLDRFRELVAPAISRHQGLGSTPWSLTATRDGSIWIGNAEGLHRWMDGQLTLYRSRGAPGHTGRGTERPGEIANSSGLVGAPQALGHDRRNRLWASTGEGIYYRDNDRFVRVGGVPGGHTQSIVGDDQGNVWISNMSAGLYVVSPEHAVQRIPWSQFGHAFAWTLLPDPMRGGLWLGFQDGGIAYFKDAKVGASYSLSDGFGSGVVSGLRFGSRGILWASTEGGLSRIDDGHIMTLASRNGLPCDAVHWSIEDTDHSVWLSMPCGLARVTRSELDRWIGNPDYSVHTSIFDISDGVRPVGIAGGYDPAAIMSQDGRIWFLQRDGVGFIDPRRLPHNDLPPPVYIEQVTADRITRDANAGLRLPPLLRDLRIDYTALSFVAPEKNQFRIKLEGRDRDWQDVGTRRQAFYTDLGPGRYRFRVVASNNSAVWNETGASLEFSIAPAYYQTRWFQAAVAMWAIALLFVAYRLRIHQVARQLNRTFDARISERTRIARDLHDTLLQSFQGLLLRFQSASNVLPARPDEAKERLDRALDEAQAALTEGRDAVQGLRASATTANDLANGIAALGAALAGDPSTASPPAIAVHVEGASRDLNPVVREEAYRIAGEALRNAVIHAQARQITVTIHYEARQFRVAIRDDGKGIDALTLQRQERAGHFGLPGIRERAAIVRGQLDVRSQRGVGTEIELRIPGAIAYRRSTRRSG